MFRRKGKAVAGVAVTAAICTAFSIVPASAAITNPDVPGDVPQYVVTQDAAKASLKQILTSGDTTSKGVSWQGIPDGMGAIEDAKKGTVTYYVNHELSASDFFVQKTDQSYGGFGANISKVTYSKSTGKVTSFGPAIKKVQWYDYQANNWSTAGPTAPTYAAETDSYSTPLHTSDLNRFCSATLVDNKALRSILPKYTPQYVTRTKVIKGKKVTQYKNSRGKWSTTVTAYKQLKKNVTYGVADSIFLTGEEGGDESRMFGLNTTTGELVQLPALGLGATENIIVAPSSKTKRNTVALTGEDGAATDSQLFMYRGVKMPTGTWAAKAGLTNGNRYVAQASIQSPTFASNVTTNVTKSVLANDVAVRTALRAYTISSVKSGDNAKVTAASYGVAGGEVTVTLAAGAQKFVVGDDVTISGFSVGGDATKAALLNGSQKVTSVSATTFKYRIDDETLAIASGTTTDPVVAANDAANRVFLTTSAAHNFAEGDTVVLRGNSVAGLDGKFTIESTPLDTVFSVTAAVAAQNGAPTAASGFAAVTANKVVNVAFQTVPTEGNNGKPLSGEAQQAVAANRGTEFARIEDMMFDPTNPNVAYFVTTQSDSDGAATDLTVPGGTDLVRDSTTKRDGGAIWRITFKNVANPTLGATLELVLNGSETPANDPAGTGATANQGGAMYKPDNIVISADGKYAFIQEDPGTVDRVTRLLAVRFSDSKLVTVAHFDFNLFDPKNNASTYMTNDEETSGIINITSQVDASVPTFLFNAQIHPLAKAGGVSYSDSTSGGNQPLQSQSAAILRPDLLTRDALTVTGASVNTGSNTATVTVSNAVNASSDGYVITGASSDIGVGDTITLTGINTSVNGTYVVNAINTGAGTITVKTSGTTSASIDGTPGAYTIDPTKAYDFKVANSEGGALYKMALPGGWAGLFS